MNLNSNIKLRISINKMNDEKWINVHTFDGVLKNIFFPQYAPSKDDKLMLFNKLKNSIRNPHARNMIEIIINDLTQNKPVIHNGVEQTDLLYEVCMVYEKGDLTFFKEFEEQLSDIRLSGTCPSGRITRLIQVWRSLYGIVEDHEFRDKVRSLCLFPTPEDKKTEIMKELYRSYDSSTLKNLIKEYADGRLIYYDGIELWFLLANFCQNASHNKIAEWVRNIEDINTKKLLNTKNLFMSIVNLF